MPGTSSIHKYIKDAEFQADGVVIVNTYSSNFKGQVESRLSTLALSEDKLDLRSINTTLTHKKNVDGLTSYEMQFPSAYSQKEVKMWFYKIVGDKENFRKIAVCSIVSFETQDSNWLHNASTQIDELSSFETQLKEIVIKSTQSGTHDIDFPETIAHQKEFWFCIINRQYQEAFEKLAVQYTQQNSILLSNNSSSHLNLFQQANVGPENIKQRFEILMSAPKSSDSKSSALLQILYVLSSTEHFEFAMQTVTDLLCKPNNIQILYAVLNKQLPSDNPLYIVLDLLKKVLSEFHTVIDWHIDNSKSHEIQFWTYTNASSLRQVWDNQITYLKNLAFQELDGIKIESKGDGHFHRMIFPNQIPNHDKLFWFNTIVNPPDSQTLSNNNEANEESQQINMPVSQGYFNRGSFEFNPYVKTIVFNAESTDWHNYALHRISTLSSFEINLSKIEVKQGDKPKSYIISFPKEIFKQREFWFYIINEQYKKAFESLSAKYIPRNNLPPQEHPNSFPDSDDLSTIQNYFVQATSFANMDRRLKLMLTSNRSLYKKFWLLMDVLHHLFSIRSTYFNFFMNAIIEQLSKPNNIHILRLLMGAQLSADNPFFDLHNHLKQIFATHYAIIDWYIDSSKQHEIRFWTHDNASSLAQLWKMRCHILKTNIIIKSMENGHFHQFIFPDAISESEKLHWFHYITRLPEKTGNYHLVKPVLNENNNINNNNNIDNTTDVYNVIADFHAQKDPFSSQKRKSNENDNAAKRSKTSYSEQRLFPNSPTPAPQTTTREEAVPQNQTGDTITKQTSVASTVEENRPFFYESADDIEFEEIDFLGDFKPEDWGFGATASDTSTPSNKKF